MLEYVLDQEAGDSDDDFNVFDQMAAGCGDEDAQEYLGKEFMNKLKRVKDNIATEEGTQEKLDRFVSRNNL